MTPSLLVLALLCGSAPAIAADIAVARGSGVRVTLTDEPCNTTAISNLPFRSKWVENGKQYEGCWGGGGGVIVMYFIDDRSVVGMLSTTFQRLTNVRHM